MEANYELRGEVLVVELKGRLDFETTEPFRRTCLGKLLSEKVVFDLRALNFVGSLGLKDFVDTLEQLAQNSTPGVRFCGVSSEFRRMFEANATSNLQFFDNREKALASFQSV